MTFDSAKAALASTRFVDLRWVQETGSTNADMVGLLAEVTVSPDRPVVLVTDFQSAGRGRLDRTWAAPAGSSVLMTIGLPIAHVPADRWTLLTSALALAVAGAPSVEGVLKVKWPNDLVAVGVGDDGGDRKVGGVLAELRDIPGRGSCALLGIGLNANWPDLPADLQSTATSLQRLLGHPVDRESLVAEVLASLDRAWLPILEDLHHPVDRLLDSYRAASATIGRRVRVELPNAELIGVARDVTPIGEIVIVDDQQVERSVSVGDVVHLRPLGET